MGRTRIGILVSFPRGFTSPQAPAARRWCLNRASNRSTGSWAAQRRRIEPLRLGEWPLDRPPRPASRIAAYSGSPQVAALPGHFLTRACSGAERRVQTKGTADNARRIPPSRRCLAPARRHVNPASLYSPLCVSQLLAEPGWLLKLETPADPPGCKDPPECAGPSRRRPGFLRSAPLGQNDIGKQISPQRLDHRYEPPPVHRLGQVAFHVKLFCP